MISLPGVDRKNYSSFRSGPLPEIPCPDCSHLLGGHGCYSRYVDGQRMKIRRVRCRRCKVSHAVLPEDVCAYRDVTLETLSTVLSEEGGPSERARCSAQKGRCGVRRVRRWLRESCAPCLARLASVIPCSSPGLWWRRALDAFGSLLEFRRWLWRETGYFFAGLAGFFRHGRPRFKTVERSPHVGIFRPP